MDYSGLATMSIFQNALDEDEPDEIQNVKHMKNGSINYVALMDNNKDLEVIIFELRQNLTDLVA